MENHLLKMYTCNGSVGALPAKFILSAMFILSTSIESKSFLLVSNRFQIQINTASFIIAYNRHTDNTTRYTDRHKTYTQKQETYPASNYETENQSQRCS